MHNFFLVDLVTVTIVLGIMIFVHEWGHFAAAKLCGVRVDVFSLGFGPRLFGVKRGDTDYRLSALPFGGYVRMAGDNPLEERTGAGYEFLSRPRWQRVIIAIAGPVMNFVLALVILWGIFWRLGIPSPVYEHQPADVVAVPQTMPATGVQAGRPHHRRQRRPHSHVEKSLLGIRKSQARKSRSRSPSRAAARTRSSPPLCRNISPRPIICSDTLRSPAVIAEVERRHARGSRRPETRRHHHRDERQARRHLATAGRRRPSIRRAFHPIPESVRDGQQSRIRHHSHAGHRPRRPTSLASRRALQHRRRLRAPILRRSRQRRRRLHRLRHPPDRPSPRRPLQRQSFHPPAGRPGRHRPHLR